MATAAVKSGAAPFNMPASEESIRCWAKGNRRNGTAIQTTPRRAIAGQSEPGRARRAPGTAASVAAPKTSRRSVTSAGSWLSRPIAMNRNDEPHIAATAASSPQSPPPKTSK